MYVFLYVFGTWAYCLSEWWRRSAVIVRLFMCDMHTVFLLFAVFFLYFLSKQKLNTHQARLFKTCGSLFTFFLPIYRVIKPARTAGI